MPIPQWWLSGLFLIPSSPSVNFPHDLLSCRQLSGHWAYSCSQNRDLCQHLSGHILSVLSTADWMRYARPKGTPPGFALPKACTYQGGPVFRIGLAVGTGHDLRRGQRRFQMKQGERAWVLALCVWSYDHFGQGFTKQLFSQLPDWAAGAGRGTEYLKWSHSRQSQAAEVLFRPSSRQPLPARIWVVGSPGFHPRPPRAVPAWPCPSPVPPPLPFLCSKAGREAGGQLAQEPKPVGQVLRAVERGTEAGEGCTACPGLACSLLSLSLSPLPS